MENIIKLKHCSYCGLLSDSDEIKTVAYGLFAQYNDICQHCYDSSEYKANMDYVQEYRA